MISIVLALALFAQVKPAMQSFTGRVTGVHDGDTISVRLDNLSELKVRLAALDAPEVKQPFWEQSKRALSEKVFDKEVKILWRERDRHGQIVGHVMVDDHWINHQMVQEGWAWGFNETPDDGRIGRWQTEARTFKRGLWADSHPIPPWEFRHDTKPVQSPQPTPPRQRRRLLRTTPPTLPRPAFPARQ
jgi:micrococcal nuclease